VLAIRLADGQDLPALQRIERLAGAPFRSLGMDKVADDEPLAVQALAEFQVAGRAWVAEDDGELVGYILAEIVGQVGAYRAGLGGSKICGPSNRPAVDLLRQDLGT